ncbi:MAG: hypothetical protein Q8M15_01205 [Bacteroidota bacterium]|nr:hypothetical protein [Bacteroidota bacterium]
MILNDYGKIASDQWYWLEQQYQYINLYEFVVMPNHIHGIIEIKRHVARKIIDEIEEADYIKAKYQSSEPMKIKSLSELMGAYKTTSSKKIHLAGYKEFNWQRSFHDHIIRNDNTFGKISRYIKNNPLKWERDRFNKKPMILQKQ